MILQWIHIDGIFFLCNSVRKQNEYSRTFLIFLEGAKCAGIHDLVFHAPQVVLKLLAYLDIQAVSALLI